MRLLLGRSFDVILITLNGVVPHRAPDRIPELGVDRAPGKEESTLAL